MHPHFYYDKYKTKTFLKLCGDAKSNKKESNKKTCIYIRKAVKYNGTFEDMIAISTAGAGTKEKSKKHIKLKIVFSLKDRTPLCLSGRCGFDSRQELGAS